MITSEKPRKLHWDLSRYLLCAYENTTLALACAWRGVGNNFTTEIQKNSKGTTHVQNVSRYLLCANNRYTLALACAWKDYGKLPTNIRQKYMYKATVHFPRNTLCATFFNIVALACAWKNGLFFVIRKLQIDTRKWTRTSLHWDTRVQIVTKKYHIC